MIIEGIFASSGQLVRRIWSEAVYLRSTVNICGKLDTVSVGLSRYSASSLYAQSEQYVDSTLTSHHTAISQNAPLAKNHHKHSIYLNRRTLLPSSTHPIHTLSANRLRRIPCESPLSLVRRARRLPDRCPIDPRCDCNISRIRKLAPGRKSHFPTAVDRASFDVDVVAILQQNRISPIIR